MCIRDSALCRGRRLRRRALAGRGRLLGVPRERQGKDEQQREDDRTAHAAAASPRQCLWEPPPALNLATASGDASVWNFAFQAS